MNRFPVVAAALCILLVFVVSSCDTDRVSAPAGTSGPASMSKGTPQNAEQIVFSGTGTSSLGPFGFWVWSEDQDAANPYHGEATGSVYLYALQLTKHVDGTVQEISPGTYAISVAAADNSVVVTLTNVPPVTRGPSNTVNATFTAPSSGTGTSTNAVVNVTGPS